MHSNGDEPVPGISDDDIAAAVQTLPKVPTTTVGDPDRFFREIRHLVEERAQAGWTNESDANVAAFIMVPYPRQVKERYGIERVLDLRAVSRPILGSLFFLSIDGTNGCAMAMPVNDADILDWLEDEGFQLFPVALAYRGSLRMVPRASGASGPARYDKIRETPPVASLEGLLDALRHFHADKLLTPSICSDGVWERGRANAYVPGAHPEKAIQYDMKIALSSWFRGGLRVEMEDATPLGRIDVRVLQRNRHDGTLSYWAIIELKVMRSFHNAPKGKTASTVSISENIEAVVEGVKQVNAYKRDRTAAEGVLEVFDMRKDKSINVTDNFAVKWQLSACDAEVVLNVRPMFGSAKDARDTGHS